MATVKLPQRFEGMSPVQVETMLGLQRGDILQIISPPTAVLADVKVGVVLPIVDADVSQAAISDEILTAGLAAYKGWAGLSATKKDAVLRNLLGYALRKEGAL